jgi:hypothetical protein
MNTSVILPYAVLPPGTLCADLEHPQMAAIELGILLGLRVQQDFPNLARDYRSDQTLSMLVTSYGIMHKYNVGFAVAESSLVRALHGYAGHLNAIALQSYPGVIPADELKEIGERHNRETGKAVGDEMHRLGLGIHALSKAQKILIRLVSSVGSGFMPYSQREIDFIEELAAKPEYRKGSLVKVFEICFEVNLRFHAGKEIRFPKSITKIRLRQKQKKENQEKVDSHQMKI